MKKVLLLSAVVFGLFSCNSKSNSEKTENPTTTDSTTLVDEHTSQTSLDYYGVYEGLTPCADCEGIKMKVTLSKDGTYLLETAYVKNGEDVLPSEESGQFTWAKDGSTIKLEGIKDGPNQFFVGEGHLSILDQEGNKIESSLKDMYVLKQVEVF